MKESDRIAAEHEKNGTDPFGNPELVTSLEAPGYISFDGTKWDSDWEHSPTHPKHPSDRTSPRGYGSRHHYTLLANCKDQGLEPEEYLKEILHRLPHNANREQAAALQQSTKPAPKPNHTRAQWMNLGRISAYGTKRTKTTRAAKSKNSKNQHQSLACYFDHRIWFMSVSRSMQLQAVIESPTEVKKPNFWPVFFCHSKHSINSEPEKSQCHHSIIRFSPWILGDQSVIFASLKVI